MGRDPNQQKMAEMIRFITQRGPRINQIAREIGVYKETVRYWYANMLKDGFTVQASRSHEKLGLKRVIMVVEVGEIFHTYADALMYALGDLCYVVSFAKTLPDGFYLVNASVPTECLNSWSDFMLSLKLMGVFRSVTSIVLDWVRNVPMKAEMYDFRERRWDFDWSKRMTNPTSTDFEVAERETYDSIDLGIIEQLQLDGNIQVTEIANRLKVNQKTVAYHYEAHVLRKGLISGYIVNWTGTGYDRVAEKPVHRRHSYMWVDLMANGLSNDEKIRLMGLLNQTPFIWLQGCGSTTYFARMAFPTELMPEALVHLESAVSPVRQKVKWFHMDQTHALWFTLPKQYYDQKQQLWTFNKEELQRRFEVLVQKTGKGMS